MLEPLRRALQAGGDITVTARITDSPVHPATPPAEVLVVDVESLGQPGLDLIRAVMRMTPLPVLVLCPPDADSPLAIQALLSGAVDAIPRHAGLEASGRLMRQRTHLVRGVGVIRRSDVLLPQARPAGRSMVAIAASTGGPAALAALLSQLVGLPAPVLLVQHLHKAFMADFVSWLGGLSPLPVSEAQHAETIQPGRVYVAPAGQHLRLADSHRIELSDQPDTVHKPSADELFSSIAANAGAAAVGVVLTGMGRDGAAGLLAMRRAGALTLVQDEASSAVFGMPQAALQMGAADASATLDAIAAALLAAVTKPTTTGELR
jgi:two-component system chemotaxis response regulator CheB